MARYDENKIREERGGAVRLPDYTAYAAGEPERTRRGPMDIPFLILVLIILAIGVLMVLSSSFATAYYVMGRPTYYFVRQLIFAVTGIAIMLVAGSMPVSFYRRTAFMLYLVTILMLAAVPIIGVTENGAKRWLGIRGVFTFQPSEIAKVAVVLMFANMICTYKDKMKTFRYGILPFGLALLPVVGLVMLERHVSGTAIITAVAASMMFLGGSNILWLVGIGGSAAAALAAFIMATGYTSSRVTAWLDPFADRLGDGWQIIQSLYSIGSGGLLGLGLGQSRQKYMYLPYAQNDYIFSIYCEELGFIGALLLLALFALLIIRGYWLAMHARDRFGALVVGGLTSMLAIQVILNVLVVTNTIPSTGISLPFFSYGGTALWLQLGEMGIILAVSRDIPLRRSAEEEGEEA